MRLGGDTEFYMLAESGASGSTTVEFVYFTGRRVAMRDAASGIAYYIFADHRGSTPVVTDPSGTVCRDVDYYPFGAEKITLMHRNPVKRGLVERGELWRWSSFRYYAYREQGLVRVNAPIRLARLSPTQRKAR